MGEKTVKRGLAIDFDADQWVYCREYLTPFNYEDFPLWFPDVCPSRTWLYFD